MRAGEGIMPQEWTPQSKTAKTVFDVGFMYDPAQNIIYSRMDAWQRRFGYAYAYDFAAPATISAVIDCEPFFFSYDGRDWMIELWKGQYGLETGAEIGVYVSGHSEDRGELDKVLGRRPHDKEHGRFYDCADDSERLTLSFTLKRNGAPLFKRGPEVHWWLTGFMWGVLSDPADLVMDVRIDFPNTGMSAAFVDALKMTGYTNIDESGTSVGFTFNRPKTFQPRADPDCAGMVSQAGKDNRAIVKKYNSYGLPSNDPNIMDDTVVEVARYFGGMTLHAIEEALVPVLKARGIRPSKTRKALEEVWSRSAGIFEKMWNGIKKIARKIRD